MCECYISTPDVFQSYFDWGWGRGSGSGFTVMTDYCRLNGCLPKHH